MAVWLLLGAFAVSTVSFTNRKVNEMLISEIRVEITDSLSRAFLKKEDVLTLIESENKDIRGIEQMLVNTKELEQAVLKNPTIKSCEVYTQIGGKLRVEVTQRNPIVRLMPELGSDYYVDEDGYILPESQRFAAHVLICNGDIPSMPNINGKVNLYDLEDEKYHVLKDVYAISKFIYNSEFWKPQIEQLYAENNEFEVIPRVGAHIIKLGSTANFEYKFRKLYTLYKKGFSQVGWNQYEIINLKYSNQVVCTKR